MLYIMTVLGAISIILFIQFPIHLLVFIVRRIKAKNLPDEAKPRFSALGVYIAVIVGFFALSFIAPSYGFKSKARQSEAKTNLGAIHTTQIAYHGETGVYASGDDTFEILQWEPEGDTRYSYFCGGDVIHNTRGERVNLSAVPGEHGTIDMVTDTAFTCGAAGNVDKDDGLDIWTMDHEKNLSNVHDDTKGKLSPWVSIGMALIVLTSMTFAVLLDRKGTKNYREARKQQGQ